MSNIKALRQRKATLVIAQRAINDLTTKEERNMTESESALYENNIKALTSLEESLIREENLLEVERSMAVTHDENQHASSEARNPAAEPKGFKTLGEQLVAVVRASKSDGRDIDPRLLYSLASGLNESAPSDGGFLVQKEFSTELIQRVYEMGDIVSRVRRIPIGANANGIRVNAIDEDSRADGSRWGGILAYWINEADTKIASKPKFRQLELNLNKLVGLCYATDELLQDAAALEAIIQQIFPQEITFKVEDAIISGTGSGQPLGIMNSGAVLTIAKDSSDTTPTVSTPDVLNMYSRLWARSRMNAVWLVNPEVEPKLFPLTLGSGTAVQLLFFPAGSPVGNNVNGTFGRLFGLPVIPNEHMAALGTPGDILLADLSEYLLADKGAPQAASSIHVRFLNDETTFRFVYRVDGQPTWKKPLTPKNGSSTVSPFVALATRS
jgi:HK97 family phage major capsid protein